MSAFRKQVPSTVILANAAAVVTLVPIALHQLGVLGHLPDPPSSVFQSDRLTESKMAHPLGIPDGLLGIGSFSATLALALLGRSHRNARKLLAVKLLGDTAFAGFNVVRQVVSFQKLCSWCTGTAICTFISAAAAVPLIQHEVQVGLLKKKLADGPGHQ